MEAELQSAVDEYRTQLVALDELLAADPDNAEVQEVHKQLQEALQYTLGALSEAGDKQHNSETANAGGDGASGRGGEAIAAAAAVETAPVAGAARPRGGAPNNARMHPSNRYYNQEPDFGALARQYEELRPYVRTDAAGRGHLDTTSWEASRALTCCLLRHDFGVRWWLPEGQLVPPVTNRANYIHWINDLLQLSAPPGGGVLRGLDIGCGANFIYCLLGAVLYGWNMVGVDVTQVAVRSCHQLIADNPQVAPLLEVRDLSRLHAELRDPEAAAPAGSAAPAVGRRGRKRPAHGQDPAAPLDSEQEVAAPSELEVPTAAGSGERAVTGEEGGVDVGGEAGGDKAGGGDLEGDEQAILLPVFEDEEETFAFSMCNPPFFESMQEAAQNPNTAFGGTAAEMVCPGGELAFVLRMLVESEVLQQRVYWFSTMVGKKSTLKALRRELHARHVTALRSTELAQGKTSRWAVAWSWQVDPNKASQPLRRVDAADERGAAEEAGAPSAAGHGRDTQAPRRAPPVPAPLRAGAGMPVMARRHISFTVQQAGSLTSRTILQQVQELLQGRGCGPVQVDQAVWTLSWGLQAGPSNASTPSEPRTADPSKRPQAEAQEGSGSWASNITARLRIAQQQRGRWEVVATIPNSAPDAAARAFAGLMASLVLDLAALAAGQGRCGKMNE